MISITFKINITNVNKYIIYNNLWLDDNVIFYIIDAQPIFSRYFLYEAHYQIALYNVSLVAIIPNCEIYHPYLFNLLQI